MKDEFEVVAASHWLQVVVTMLLLGQGAAFFFLKVGDKTSM